MRYIRESLVLASFIIGILGNALLFKIHFWRNDTLISTIAIWVCATSILSYCVFRFLMAIAKGGKIED